MTELHLPKGTCLTVDGIAVTVDSVSLDPRGHWVHPVVAPGSPTVPFILGSIEAPAKLLDGTLAIGPTAAHGGDEFDKYDGLSIGTASKADAEVAVGRLHLVEAWEDAGRLARRSEEGVASRRATALAAVSLPEGMTVPSGSTMRRLSKTFRRGKRGEASLLPRHAYKGNRERRLPDFVIDAVEAAIDRKYTGKGSVPEVVDCAVGLAKSMLPADLGVYVRRRRIGKTKEFETVPLIERRPDGSVDWALLITPNFVRKSIAKRIAIDRASMIHDAKAAKEMFAVTAEGPGSNRLLHRTETDNFRLGVFVVDDVRRLPLGFPWVTVLLDIASRAVIGLHVGFLSPSGETVAQCLKHAVMPKNLKWTGKRPDGSPVISHPWQMFGTPAFVACDQGGDFISHQTRDGCYRLGMHLLPLPPGAPKMKGKVERFIKTLKYGKVGRILGLVPALREIKKGDGPLVLTLDELRLILTYWIVEIYHQTKHSALGKSPAQKWDEMAKTMRVIPPPKAEDMALCVGRWETRVLDDQGIRTNGLKYNSPALGVLRAVHAKDEDKGKLRGVDVKGDDEDISAVEALIEDPDHKGRSLVAKAYCTQSRYTVPGTTRHQHLIIKEHAKVKAPKGRITVSQLIEARLELNAIADQILGDRKATGGHVKVARYLDIGRDRLLGYHEGYDVEQSRQLLELGDEEVVEEAPTSGGPEGLTPKSPRKPRTRSAKPRAAAKHGFTAVEVAPDQQIGTRLLAEAAAPRERIKLEAIDE